MVNRVRFQPLIQLNDNKIFGYEVLFTKKHSLYPRAHSMLKYVASKLKLDDNCLVFINMTEEEIIKKDFCQSFLDVIEKNQIISKNIVLEVSENTNPVHLPQLAKVLSLLRNHHIKVALDDFGTQYSSLSFLKDLPVDMIKIDKKFVREAPSSKKSRTLLKCCAKISNDMGCNVIAEGIETLDQLNCVKDCDVNIGQGFLFIPFLDNLNRNVSPFMYSCEMSSVHQCIKLCYANQ